MNIEKSMQAKIVVTLFLVLLFFFSFDSAVSLGTGIGKGIFDGLSSNG